MSGLRQFIFCLTIALSAFVARAQDSNLAPKEILPISPNLIPLPPAPQSPVTFFRNLLAMTPKARADFLTNRPSAIRARILVKLHEYESLSPDERELRLQATELRWYLMPLLQLPPTNRNERVAQVPDNLRPLVKNRLVQWDILPPPLKQVFLANDKTLHYFTSVETTNQADINPEHEKIAEQFNEFFELTPGEKQKTLNTLSDAERAQMEKTLATFDQLPPTQRLLCLRNYAKFAGMSVAERAEFLKNAEHWSQMSPAERQTWRDLVAHVPEWPPLPPMIPPNLIPRATPVSPKLPHPSVATN